MSYKYRINKQFFFLKNKLINSKTLFELSKNTIHKARNELKIIQIKNIDCVMKAFKIPNIINQILYSYFRDSKAKRSYEYSLRLKDFTPTPIGYIEFYKNELLSESYFVSEEFKYDFTIREPLLDDNFFDRDNVFKAFARFTYKLHQNNILHLDYSPGNILIKREKDSYIIKIVDINRMQFKVLKLNDKLKNFSKLWASDIDMTIIAEEYAKISQEDKSYCVKQTIFYSQKNKNFKNFKKRLKGKKIVN